jgi:hypothetical protein
MAHDPKVRAAAVTEIILGHTYDQISAKHDVPKSTVKLWADELKTAQNCTEPESLPISAEARKERFNKALDEFLMSSVQMLNAWAEACSDPGFIRSNPTGVNELGAVVLDRADRLVRHVSKPDAD